MRIRIKFRKYGVMRFVGHLDIMRFFQKAIRRADIDIAYSEGFSPHQIMSFAAPLGVGVTSDGEYFDIEVNSTQSTEASIRALNQVMVDGIEILEYVKLPEHALKAMTSVAAADYIVYFKHTVDFSQEEIREMIRQYYTERTAIPIVKQTKKSVIELDVRPLIYSFLPFEQRIGNADWYCTGLECCSGFAMKLCTGSKDNIKPDLVLKDFYSFYHKTYDPGNLQIHRREVYENSDGVFRPLYQAGENIL